MVSASKRRYLAGQPPVKNNRCLVLRVLRHQFPADGEVEGRLPKLRHVLRPRRESGKVVESESGHRRGRWSCPR